MRHKAMKINFAYRIRVFLTLIIFCGTITAATAQSRTDSLDRFLKNKMKELKIPGLQLAIVRHGKITRLGIYGTASIEFAVPVNKNTIFPVNSMTKAFTGVAVMQLVEAGKLDLEAPLSRYLDSLPAAWGKITIKQVMTHMSGIPDIVDGNMNLISSEGEQASYRKAMTLPMDFQPTEKFSYNQMNYALIGKIITKLSGEPFTQFIAEHQFKVANMPLTGYYDSKDVVPNIGRTYTYLRFINGDVQMGDQINTRYEEFPPIIRTAAGIHTTAEELARWLIALQQGKLLKDKSSLATLWTPGRLKDGTTAGFSDLLNGYAIGWPVVVRAKHPAVAPVGGERAAMFYYPEDDLGIVVLTNLMGASPQAFTDQIAAFYFSK
jgi:CubicO group peptidase (beta-lactamase class C family)